MKLISYVHGGTESWGAVMGEHIADLASRTGYATLAEFLGSPAFQHRDTYLPEAPTLRLDQVALLPVIPRPEKIVCVLRNYLDPTQAQAVSQADLPAYPPLFLRTWRSQAAHNAPIVHPKESNALDWEGELAVVIGKAGRRIPEDQAYEYVAGYACYNDGSVRDWQAHARQIASGKNFEGTGGFGPWLVTADELDPARPLRIQTRLNGEVVQDGDTSQMIFGIPRLINYISTIVTLVPGDVIVTGTPAGSGFTRKPPRFMKPGDVCEVEIDGIGVLRNPIIMQD